MLSFVVLLSILSMALAPLSSGAATMQVICGTEGVETILLNAQGDPVDPADRCDCPSCIGCASYSAPPPPVGTWLAAPPGSRRAETRPGIAQTCPQPGYTRPIARGPPAEKGRCNV
ncbi:hypothetical protein [Paracoccus lutimaris]|nr:hypothetical protein [Paracoccus lutimaris]